MRVAAVAPIGWVPPFWRIASDVNEGGEVAGADGLLHAAASVARGVVGEAQAIFLAQLRRCLPTTLLGRPWRWTGATIRGRRIGLGDGRREWQAPRVLFCRDESADLPSLHRGGCRLRWGLEGGAVSREARWLVDVCSDQHGFEVQDPHRHVVRGAVVLHRVGALPGRPARRMLCDRHWCVQQSQGCGPGREHPLCKSCRWGGRFAEGGEEVRHSVCWRSAF